MRNKLLFGRSIDTGSWVHAVDPRAKLAGMVLYLVAIVAVGSWPALAVAAVFSIGYMLSTKIPLKYYLKAAKPLWALMVFIFVVQCLTVESGRRSGASAPGPYTAAESAADSSPPPVWGCWCHSPPS